MKIFAATTKSHFEIAKKIFLEYASSINIDLCFQNFDKELEIINKMYNKPNGTLLLTEKNGNIFGCAGIRIFKKNVAELKRMYIKPEFRRKGVGKILLNKVILSAKELGYSKIVLDTLSSMKSAITLYRSFGFNETKPYYHNPNKEAKYFELII